MHFTVLCFPLPAKLCSHPAARLAGEMYLLTSINPAVLQAFTSHGTPVNETSFNRRNKNICFYSVNNATIEQYLSNIMLAVTGVMHEADDAYSIWSTWSCYWLDQFLTLALDAWILSKFSTLYWICLLLVFLVLVGVELPLCL